MKKKLYIGTATHTTVIEYIINDHNIKIIDSWKITDKPTMAFILMKILIDDEYGNTRDRHIAEYVREWRAHNIMNHIPLKYFKKHCKDCDLSNNESRFRLFVYNILGRL